MSMISILCVRALSSMVELVSGPLMVKRVVMVGCVMMDILGGQLLK